MVMTHKIVSAVLYVAIAQGMVGCVHSPTPSLDALEKELLSADRSYEAYNREYGFKAASQEFVDFDSAFMIEAGEGFLTTETDILAARDLTTVPSPVRWQPIGAMAGGGDLGITWGSYSIDSTPMVTGNYVTVWRQVDGEWKIVTDVALDDPSTD